MRHDQILENNKNYPVFQFCKNNNINCHWDFSRKDSTAWTEILIEGKIVMQIEHTTTVKQFKAAIKILMKNFNTKDFTQIPGDDFWFVTGTRESFDKFLHKYESLFQ